MSDERTLFRRHAMLGIPVPGYFPSDPEALLVNDAFFTFTREGTQLPSWFASAYTDPAAFDGQELGVLKRLKELVTPIQRTDSDDDRQVWELYKNWQFDTSGELIGDDPRTPRERLEQYYAD